jgi:hypothetical protein
MPRKRYTLESDGPRRLEVAWQNRWKNMTIHLDGELLGTIPTRQDLLLGREYTLSDGSILQVKLVKRSIDNELHILRDGRPVPGSYTDPVARYRLAYGILLGLTAVYLGVGVVSVLTHSAFLQGIGVGSSAVLLGSVFATLAYFVKRRSAVAMGAAAVVLLTDALLSFAILIIGGRTPGLLGLVIRLTLAFPMLDGMEAIRELRAEEKRQEEEEY